MSFRARAAAALLSLATLSAQAASVRVPDETRVFLVTLEEIVAKKRHYAVGDLIPVEVWRDVVVDGRTVIAAKTPATLRVDSIRARTIVGIKGKVSFAAVGTSAVDGQVIQLAGGYNKAGRGFVPAAATIGALVFWPALFIPGGAPRFPANTVFDAVVDGSYLISTDDVSVVKLPRDQFFSVEVDYARLTAADAPTQLEMLLRNVNPGSTFVVDRVNEQPIKPLPVRLGAVDGNGVRASVNLKKLSRFFQPGINRFEVATTHPAGDRVAAEVVLEMQF